MRGERGVSLICIAWPMLSVDITASVGESVVRNQFVFADLLPATIAATPLFQ